VPKTDLFEGKKLQRREFEFVFLFEFVFCSISFSLHDDIDVKFGMCAISAIICNAGKLKGLQNRESYILFLFVSDEVQHGEKRTSLRLIFQSYVFFVRNFSYFPRFGDFSVFFLSVFI